MSKSLEQRENLCAEPIWDDLVTDIDLDQGGICEEILGFCEFTNKCVHHVKRSFSPKNEARMRSDSNWEVPEEDVEYDESEDETCEEALPFDEEMDDKMLYQSAVECCLNGDPKSAIYNFEYLYFDRGRRDPEMIVWYAQAILMYSPLLLLAVLEDGFGLDVVLNDYQVMQLRMFEAKARLVYGQFDQAKETLCLAIEPFLDVEMFSEEVVDIRRVVLADLAWVYLELEHYEDALSLLEACLLLYEYSPRETVHLAYRRFLAIAAINPKDSRLREQIPRFLRETKLLQNSERARLRDILEEIDQDYWGSREFALERIADLLGVNLALPMVSEAYIYEDIEECLDMADDLLPLGEYDEYILLMFYLLRERRDVSPDFCSSIIFRIAEVLLVLERYEQVPLLLDEAMLFVDFDKEDLNNIVSFKFEAYMNLEDYREAKDALLSSWVWPEYLNSAELPAEILSFLEFLINQLARVEFYLLNLPEVIELYRAWLNLFAGYEGNEEESSFGDSDEEVFSVSEADVLNVKLNLLFALYSQFCEGKFIDPSQNVSRYPKITNELSQEEKDELFADEEFRELCAYVNARQDFLEDESRFDFNRLMEGQEIYDLDDGEPEIEYCGFVPEECFIS